MQTFVHSDAEAISTDFLFRKSRKVYGTSSYKSNWFGYPVEDNIKWVNHESFDVSGEILGFSLQTRELLDNYWVITRELLGISREITVELI